MTRVISTANDAALQTPGIHALVMCDLDFASGKVYLSDGISEIVWNGHTYSPLGQFAGIEAVEESVDGIARPVKLTLSGVDASLVGTAQNEVYQNRQVVIYFGIADERTGLLIDAPEIVWEGRMDYMSIALDGQVGRITLNCEHRLRREPRIARYTDADQQNLYANDSFFNFLGQIQGFIGKWGDQHMSYSGPGYPGLDWVPGYFLAHWPKR